MPALLACALLSGACGDPPNKEMDQAQGAIAAARAAGADRYAPAEYARATGSLASAQQAVAGRDYRLALSNALESREHAQNAARAAADTKARLSSDVERSMADIAALMAEASTKIEAAKKARMASRTVRGLEDALVAVNADVQKAGEAMKADDYLAARGALEGIKGRIEKVIAALDTGASAQSSRRKRQ